MKFLDSFVFRTPLCSKQQSLSDNEFKEAIYLSSPLLYDEYIKYENNLIKEEKDKKKIDISLYKYRSRASNRCTPFGLFAGIGTGTWGTTNTIIKDHNPVKAINRKTRLDMNVLYLLAQELGKQAYIKPFLKFYPNNSIYSIGENYRYVEYYYQHNRRIHKLSKVEHNEYLERILKNSNNGLNTEQLCQLLLSDEITEEEACTFIEELINAQLFVSELEPTVTGPDYFTVLMNKLIYIQANHANNSLQHIINELNLINDRIKQLDRNVFNSIETYRNIHNQLKSILPDLSETNLFQTDCYKNTEQCSLDTRLQQQIINTIDFLKKITPPYQNERLTEFKKKFTNRYEDQEIPLLIALDSESSIGYPGNDEDGINELVDDLFINSPTEDNSVKWNALQSSLHALLINSIKKNKKIIDVAENDFKEIDYSSGTLPDSIPVMFKVINSKTGKILFEHSGGSSAANLLGRFCGGNTNLLKIANALTAFEECCFPDYILAEIVHLPESRTGNILARPTIRPYEIPYLAKSSVDKQFQISVEDLLVSIKNNRIVLRSKSLNKIIIPRLGNAHNYSFNSLPVYHFLCDLQLQYYDKPSLSFNWGVLSNQYSFLPRVEYKNTILSPAKWRLKKADFEKLLEKSIPDKKKEILFLELKNTYELPDKFLITDSDNELLIDCRQKIAIETFIDSLKNRQEILLEEYLFDSEEALIKDNQKNAFTNECLAFILNEDNLNKHKTSYNFLSELKSKALFPPGSEWLYYKIYCGVKTADTILTELIKPVCEDLLEKGIIDKWFFIRYSDSDGSHLRIRFHIVDATQYGYVLLLINQYTQPLIKERVVSKVQTDTYKRELARYGDNTIELAESLFYKDSEFVVNVLDLLDRDSGGTIRWKIAIRSVDTLLNDFKYTLEEKHEFTTSMSQLFFNEHGGKKDLKLSLDDKYRKLRNEIEDILNDKTDLEKEYYPLIQLLHARSNELEEIAYEILSMKKAGSLMLSINQLMNSFIHMNLDRLFMGRNRTNEFVVYDILSRYYKSCIARNKPKHIQ